MDSELLRKKRQLRALEIAECLFEDRGYHIEYLRGIKEFLEGKEMYSPKIKEDLIPELYRRAKAKGVSMTKLVDQIIRNALDGKGQQKEENISREHNLVKPEEWELTCVIYKLRGEPRPLEAIDGVLVRDEREQKRVEKYLKELYEFPSEKDYQNFLDSFVIRDNGKQG